MRKMTIGLKLNGVLRRVEVAANDTLLEVLRDKLGVKTAKVGCDRGDCGTCTVLFNGRTVRACLVLAAEADGAEVSTLESLSKGGGTPLQKAFVKHNSFQCGFCAPGVILSATELLARNSKPTRHEIQEAISGNLCRCTGYLPIIEAIEDAAGKGV
ncbi:MAG: (2Fe-2S)-binding protein [Elusimicrobia bacterium]|nr:(2Fe-2S)-binding protein [Elusimicrobiota bacterium]